MSAVCTRSHCTTDSATPDKSIRKANMEEGTLVIGFMIRPTGPVFKLSARQGNRHYIVSKFIILRLSTQILLTKSQEMRGYIISLLG
ncbi:Uncharacterized protein HZ326_31363 [Fusarium oxysporum f. sp. albedinis]|nr:Uncharacterized protein HZ326_31363 [Fusarium oxysporum f. sp. albedinis]